MFDRKRKTGPAVGMVACIMLIGMDAASEKAAFVDGVATVIPATDGMVRDNPKVNYNDTSHNVGMDSTDSRLRSLLVFELPALPEGATIEKVELRLQRTTTVGTLDAEVQLVHLPDLNSATPQPSAYGAAPANAVVRFDPEATEPETYGPWIDVTSAVQADYANDPAESRLATFRLQIDDANLPDPESNKVHNYYRFRSMENAKIGRAPELRVTLLGAKTEART